MQWRARRGSTCGAYGARRGKQAELAELAVVEEVKATAVELVQGFQTGQAKGRDCSGQRSRGPSKQVRSCAKGADGNLSLVITERPAAWDDPPKVHGKAWRKDNMVGAGHAWQETQARTREKAPLAEARAQVLQPVPEKSEPAAHGRPAVEECGGSCRGSGASSDETDCTDCERTEAESTSSQCLVDRCSSAVCFCAQGLPLGRGTGQR